jgi:hypothetical protein
VQAMRDEGGCIGSRIFSGESASGARPGCPERSMLFSNVSQRSAVGLSSTPTQTCRMWSVRPQQLVGQAMLEESWDDFARSSRYNDDHQSQDG